MSLSSKAIVLSFEDFGEADRYVTLFTQNWGMITVLAKAARKSKRRYVGGLDLFCHNEIFIRGEPKGRPYLTELVVLNSFPGIRDNLEKLLAAGTCTQWIKKLADTSIPMESVYRLFGQTLSLIEKETDTERFGLLHLVFKLKLLSLLGLKPRVDQCTRCDNTDFLTNTIFRFEMGAGGIICDPCVTQARLGDRIELMGHERHFLHAIDAMKLSHWNALKFPEDSTRSLSRLMTLFASYHTQLRLPI